MALWDISGVNGWLECPKTKKSLQLEICHMLGIF